jgi:hypothetical protein
MNEDRLAITIITGLIVFVIIMGFITVSGGIFIAIGYIFSLILPLSLFHSTLFCIICASFVSVFTIHSITNYDDKQKDKYQIEDEEDEDDDEEDIENEEKKSLTVINAKKVGRNENCYCGSGRKYKYCCGR